MCESQSEGRAPKRDAESSLLSVDTALELLSHPTRRAIVHALAADQHQRVTVDELVGAVRERTPEEERPTPTEIRVKLLHNHLPRLADADVIEYDHSGESVRYLGDERLESLLAGLREKTSDQTLRSESDGD